MNRRHAIRRFALCAPRPNHRGARAARGVAPFLFRAESGAAKLMPLAGFALDVPNQAENLGAFPEGAPIAASFATARIPTAGSSQTTAGQDGETSSAQVAAERTPERASASARANADWRAPTDARRAAGETGRAGRRTGQAARREAPPAHGTIKHLASLSRVSSHRPAGGWGGVSLHEPDGRPSHASVARATAGARRPFPATGRMHEGPRLHHGSPRDGTRNGVQAGDGVERHASFFRRQEPPMDRTNNHNHRETR